MFRIRDCSRTCASCFSTSVKLIFWGKMRSSKWPFSLPYGLEFFSTDLFSYEEFEYEFSFYWKSTWNFNEIREVSVQRKCWEWTTSLSAANEWFQYRTAKVWHLARLDLKASDLWRRGQSAFFDARKTHVNSLSNEYTKTSMMFLGSTNKRKNWEYNEKVEDDSFTPFIFRTDW